MATLREIELSKSRLEIEIDTLPSDTKYHDRKIHDMTLRLDGMYDTIVELVQKIEDAKLRKNAIEIEAVTLDNLYRILLEFGKMYDIINDSERKSVLTYLIKEIKLNFYQEGVSSLKAIEFNLPIYKKGKAIKELLWDGNSDVETLAVLTKLQDRTEANTLL